MVGSCLRGVLPTFPPASSFTDVTQLLRIRSPSGTARITVDVNTSGEELAQLIIDTIQGGAKPDPSTLTLSNQPGAGGERLGLDALVGRKVGDMGFR